MQKHVIRWVFIFLATLSLHAHAKECSVIFGQGETAKLTPPWAPTLNNIAWDSSKSWTDSSFATGDYELPLSESKDNFTKPFNLTLELGATVRILVRGDLTLNQDAFLNASGNPSQLLIIVLGDLTIDKGSVINAAIFATGEVELFKDIVINGAISSNSNIGTKQGGPNEANITYDPGVINPELLSGLCSSTGGAVNHFRILHGGAGVTCQATPVTFEARNNLGDIVTDYAGEVFVSTSTGKGFWQALGGSAGSLTIVPGDNSGGASYQFDPADGGVVTLGLQHTQPATVNLDITDGDVRELPSADPDLVIQRTGFVFHQDSDFSTPVGSQVSGKPSNVAPGAQNIRLTAVRESDTTGSCEAFLVGPQTVNIGQTCESPGSCSAIGSMEVNGTIVGSNPAESSANSTPVGFDFGDDTTSSAPLNLRYNDAGFVSLFAQMPLLDDEGSPTGELIAGSSGPFAVISAGFCVEAINPALACATVGADCSVGAVAGEIFNLRVSAVAWESAGESGPEFCDNPVTPNFEYADLEIDHRLLAPATGQPGAILSQSVGMFPTSEGSREVSQSVSEVGVFEFSVPAGQPYLGHALSGGVSAPVGRFTPAGFTVSLSDAGTLGSACSASPGFTYAGQSFGWSMSPELIIVPRALDGTSVTTNYLIDEFMKLVAPAVARTDPDVDRTARLADDSDLVPIDYSAGPGSVSRDAVQQVVLFYYDSDDSFLVAKSPNTRVEPFSPALEFSVDAIWDQDGVTTLASQPMPVEFEPSSDGDIRYGRLEMTNVYGPENTQQALEMTSQAAYWDGSRFVLNALDSCTNWDTSMPDPLRNAEQFHELLNESETGTLVDGVGQALRLQPDGNRGEERIRWQMPVWLQDYWGRYPVAPGDPADNELQDPEAVATFGVYRGHDRIIYWREVRD